MFRSYNFAVEQVTWNPSLETLKTNYVKFILHRFTFSLCQYRSMQKLISIGRTNTSIRFFIKENVDIVYMFILASYDWLVIGTSKSRYWCINRGLPLQKTKTKSKKKEKKEREGTLHLTPVKKKWHEKTTTIP